MNFGCGSIRPKIPTAGNPLSWRAAVCRWLYAAEGDSGFDRGRGALQRFATAQDMYGFIHKAMPFNAPGSLSDEQYLQVSAFLLESNQQLPVGSQLNSSALPVVGLRH